mmetsp:Transcript_23917/g.34992  ORF Transcript_23917/g.34992 Transcript_23917/m.34992 type:complete len:380 (+) Transcript_23917:112-1251(+)|eukprot:CAMPEP_0195526796 /NCGR_PEP_ID=MMETSP0794_2-20130614/28088_1 /TAXON_ID=515487 /ORGANISM="Stephanopyxis turris, Strain CCMP 815" /LENGTH=379 /DNA_ID=CAMNT_0040657575 /DNA_START=108 /DNA_END=1247 /DNA_ORIENTATION=+
MPKASGSKGGKSAANSRITSKIEAMAWNGDFTQVAIGVDKSIVVYSAPKADKKAWSKTAEMENAHGLDISGLDWSSVTNKIVSCSHDRNAYVWTLNEDGTWKPTLAILRISRAALCCKWSPDGHKFAVGSGSKTVPVCQFDKEQDWWNSKIINKKRGSSVQHKSSIVSVAWHPNSQFLATACADKKCRVYCARGAHDDEIQLGAMEDFVEDSDPDFGDALFEFVSQGWVHDCEWSPNGKQLAFVSHDSSVSVVNFSESSGAGDAQPLVTTIPYKGLPFTTCLFSTENQLIVAGYDFFPLRVDKDGDDWTYGKPVDEMKAKVNKKANSAMAKFQNRDNLGQDTKVEALLTKHQAAIRCLAINGSKLFSAGSDGRLQFWNL